MIAPSESRDSSCAAEPMGFFPRGRSPGFFFLSIASFTYTVGVLVFWAVVLAFVIYRLIRLCWRLGIFQRKRGETDGQR